VALHLLSLQPQAVVQDSLVTHLDSMVALAVVEVVEAVTRLLALAAMVQCCSTTNWKRY
jgi:hypothetical protein